MRFQVHLDIFDGPLDLLFYLVRKHELAISEISLGVLTQQFLEHLAVLEQLDLDSVGDFIDVASTLIEIKSRTILPRPEEESVAVEEDAPQEALVRRLLEYKAYRDAAHMLDERGRVWQERFARQCNDLPVAVTMRDEPDLPLGDGLEVWDLLSAFGRIMETIAEEPIETIPYDTTPIAVFMRRLYNALEQRKSIAFSTLFEPGSHRSTCIGNFLAVLELVRHRHAVARQQELFAEIWLELGSEPLPDKLEQIDTYNTSLPTARKSS